MDYLHIISTVLKVSMAFAGVTATFSYLYFSLLIESLLGLSKVSTELIRGISNLTKKDIQKINDPNLIKAYQFYRYRSGILTICHIVMILSFISFIVVSIYIKNRRK